MNPPTLGSIQLRAATSKADAVKKVPLNSAHTPEFEATSELLIWTRESSRLVLVLVCMWAVVQSEASILLAAYKAAVPGLQVHEVERGVILPAFSVQIIVTY